MSKTLFAGEYSSRNVGDGIIKLAIETMCRDHGVDADFRDFFGNAVSASAATPDMSTPGVPTAPTPERRMGRFKKALLASAAVNYTISVLFYLTRYKRIAASYDTEKYRQVVIGGGNLLMDNFLNF